MVLIQIILLCVVSCVSAQQAEASTSCAGAQTILGFSKDWKHVYWDQEIAGECDAGNILHVFDFEKSRDNIVSSFEYAAHPSDRKKYHAARQKIQNTTVLPRGKNHKITKNDCDFTEGICLPKDSYVGGIESIQTVYWNPQFQWWIVMTEACNAGDAVGAGGRCTYNAIYVLPKKSCTPS